MVKIEERVFISFLEPCDRKQERYRWPAQEKVEPADLEQIFMINLVVREDARILFFPQLEDVKKKFIGCREKLLQKKKHEQVIEGEDFCCGSFLQSIE